MMFIYFVIQELMKFNMISNHQMIQALKCWLLLPNHPVAKGLRKMNPEMLIGLSEGRHPICVHVICQLANCEILSHSWKTKYWKNTWKDVMSEIQSPIHAPPFRISIEEFKSCVHLVVSANVPAPSYSTATCKARFHLILFRPVLRGRQTKIKKKKRWKWPHGIPVASSSFRVFSRFLNFA